MKFESPDFSVEIADSKEDFQNPERISPSRFDTAGFVKSIRVKGQEALTWFGLSDEFGIMRQPFGYSFPDHVFLKYGFGLLKRNLLHFEVYSFMHPYPLLEHFQSKSEPVPDGISFFQELKDFRGMGYRYRKTYHVQPQEKRITISYTLENTGSEKIDTDQYNHNFFLFPKEFDTREFRITTGFAPEVMHMSKNHFHCTGHDFTGPEIAVPAYTYTREAFPAAENRVTVTHPRWPYKIRVTGDFDISFFALNLGQYYISPEVFVPIVLKPGETKEWTRTLQFEDVL